MIPPEGEPAAPVSRSPLPSMCRMSLLLPRFPPTVLLGREEIVEWLGPTVQRYLTAPDP